MGSTTNAVDESDAMAGANGRLTLAGPSPFSNHEQTDGGAGYPIMLPSRIQKLDAREGIATAYLGDTLLLLGASSLRVDESANT
jgi:hypothetical protein